jgi:hypothetical protein
MPERVQITTTDAEIDAAIRLARQCEKFDTRVVRAIYSERSDKLQLYMTSGAKHIIPRHLLQGLTSASSRDLGKIELLGNGRGIYWPSLDVAHQVSGVLAGVYGSARWMSRLQISKQSVSVRTPRERTRKSA